MSLFPPRPARSLKGCRKPAHDSPRLVEALEQRVLMDATVTLAKGGPTKVKFLDADGSQSSISVSGPGTVTVQLGGALTQATNGKTINVTGTPVSVVVGANGTTTKSSLSMSGNKGANGLLDVNSVLVLGSLSALKGKSAVIGGNLGVAGSAGNVSIDSDTAGAVTAQSISKLTVAHTFATSLSTTSLGAFKAGQVVGGTWTVGGTKTTVTADSITGLTATFDTVSKIAVKGDIIGSTLRSGGNIGTVQAGNIRASNVYAGLANLAAGLLPSAPGDFTTAASINTLKLKNFSAGSNVAASSIGKATLGTVEEVAGPRFGVGADQIKNLTATVSGKKLKLKNAQAQADVDGAFAAAAIPAQGFAVVIV
jgi:hypothetical protein